MTLKTFPGYSPLNFPHLTPALELDDAIIEFSGSLKDHGLPTEVKSMDDVELLLDAFHDYIQQFNFWQYYILDVKKEKEAVQLALSSGEIKPWEGPDITGKSAAELATILRAHRNGELIQGLSKYAKRFGVTVDGAVAAGFVQAARRSDIELVKTWGEIVDALNLPLYREWEEDVNIALVQIKNRLKYTRLEDHGPKLGEITRKSVPQSAFRCES
jgi:glycogen debranching enzyme